MVKETVNGLLHVLHNQITAISTPTDLCYNKKHMTKPVT